MMLYRKDSSWNNPLACTIVTVLVPGFALFPLSFLAQIYLHLFPWPLPVMMQHSAKLFPPLSPCSQMSVDPETTLMGAMLKGLKVSGELPYWYNSKGKMDECVIGEPLIKQIL